jgi:niacin transporter
MFSTKKTVYTSLLIAVGVVLPVSLHFVPNAGNVLLPMHVPVLICGIACGFPYGVLCGILTPLVSSLFTGMPPAAMLPAMISELAVYGLISAMLARHIRTKSICANIYIALLGAMLAGRIVFGILNSLIFRAGEYSAQIWLTSAFVTALPGIVIQLILIPGIVVALQKSKLIEVYS